MIVPTPVAGLSEAGLCVESGVIDPGYRSAFIDRSDACGRPQ
jgi:hypothetical protein